MPTSDMLSIGLGFGDEGKGSFVQYIAHSNPNIDFFEKYNGGCHGRHCVLHDNKQFVFSQLSPSFLYGKNTVLSSNFVFEPFSLINEITEISKISEIPQSEIFKRIYIDKKCICVTPIHKQFNILQEESQNGRGSVGTGVSIAGFYVNDDITLYADMPNIKQILYNQKNFFCDLCKQQDLNDELIYSFDVETYIEEISLIMTRLTVIDTNILHNGTNIFFYESSQGLLLDRKYGFYPNTTLLDTSADKKGDINNKIGLIRSIYTRHGKGIFPTEYLLPLTDISQQVGKFSGEMRFGYFDCVLFRYAIRYTGVSSIYMSHMDYLKTITHPKICIAYIYHGEIDEIFNKCFAYYRTNDGIIVSDILKQDKRLINYMSNMKPVYHDMNLYDMGFYEKTERYIKFIENLCDVDIDIISYGPNVLDKARR